MKLFPLISLIATGILFMLLCYLLLDAIYQHANPGHILLYCLAVLLSLVVLVRLVLYFFTSSTGNQ